MRRARKREALAPHIRSAHERPARRHAGRGMSGRVEAEWCGPDQRASQSPRSDRRRVSDQGDLTALLGELAGTAAGAEYPHAVWLRHPVTQSVLSVVVGAGWDFPVFLDSNQHSWSPRADSIGAPPGVSVFFVDGHWTEIDNRQRVTLELGRLAATEFCATGQLPSALIWQQDC